MKLNFQALLDYIERLQPGFRSTLRGVPRQELEAWQDRYGITLPTLYLDLMEAVGNSSGRYRPLGVYHHLFSDLVIQNDWIHSDDYAYQEDYPRKQYFMIGYEADESVVSLVAFCSRTYCCSLLFLMPYPR